MGVVAWHLRQDSAHVTDVPRSGDSGYKFVFWKLRRAGERWIDALADPDAAMQAGAAARCAPKVGGGNKLGSHGSGMLVIVYPDSI